MIRLHARAAWWTVLFLTLALLPSWSEPAQAFDWQIHKGTTIRVIQNKGSVGLGIEALIPEFEKLTGIKVQYETYTEDQYRQKVLLELECGVGRPGRLRHVCGAGGVKVLALRLVRAAGPLPQESAPDGSRLRPVGHQQGGGPGEHL